MNLEGMPQPKKQSQYPPIDQDTGTFAPRPEGVEAAEALLAAQSEVNRPSSARERAAKFINVALHGHTLADIGEKTDRDEHDLYVDPSLIVSPDIETETGLSPISAPENAPKAPAGKRIVRALGALIVGRKKSSKTTIPDKVTTPDAPVESEANDGVTSPRLTFREEDLDLGKPSGDAYDYPTIIEPTNGANRSSTLIQPLSPMNNSYANRQSPGGVRSTSTSRSRGSLQNAHIGVLNETWGYQQNGSEIRGSLENDTIDAMQFETEKLSRIFLENNIPPEVSVEFRNSSNGEVVIREGWLATRMESSAMKIKQIVDSREESASLPQHAIMIDKGELRPDLNRKDRNGLSKEFGQAKFAQFMIGTDGKIYGINGQEPFPDDMGSANDVFKSYLSMIGAKEPRSFPHVNDYGANGFENIYNNWVRILNMVLDRYK